MKKVVVSCVVLSSVVAYAASPHYKGRAGQPVCTIAGNTASCGTGEVAGLGNEDVRVTVSLAATAGTFCHNPGNQNIVPGQNPAEAVGSTSVDLSPDQLKNGTLALPAISTTVTIVTPTPDAAGCPNDGWSVTLGPVTFGPGFYTFEQPVGTVVPELSFTF